MDEPPVQEIIGWTRCGRCKNHWNLPDEWGSERPIGDSPTVDDLLAWLAGEAFFLAYISRVGGETTVQFVNTDSGLDGAYYTRPTLLAALEAAVRAIYNKEHPNG